MCPKFNFTTPKYSLRTNGIKSRITPESWDGKSVAQCINRALQDALQKTRQETSQEKLHETPQENPQDALHETGEATHGQERPIVVGAIPFDPGTPAFLYIPESTEWGAGTQVQPLKQSLSNTPQQLIRLEGLDSPQYRTAVSTAVSRIQAGELKKVVLARRLIAHSEEPFDIDTLYQRLIQRNPQAYNFQLDLPSEHSSEHTTLLGASPELLLASDDGRVQSHPLAGSTPRKKDLLEDQSVSQGLLSSPKNLTEHAYVTRAVGDSFQEFTDNTDVPSPPELVQTPVLWHLGTRITGQLKEGISPIELAYALHPTPAVCGWPSIAARNMIAELEDFDRGLFTGLIGWVDAQGTSEWALVLRCGTIDKSTATLYAGAGIVAESDPVDEHEETAVKLQTFASALGTQEGY